MTDDIVTRLQQRVDLTALVARAALGDATVCEEAAAEIARLRDIIKEAADLLISYGDGEVIYPEEQAVIDMVQKEARRG